MNNIQNITLGETGSGLIFAGFAKLDNVYLGLGLISAGVLLKVIVAFLQKYQVPVSSNLG